MIAVRVDFNKRNSRGYVLSRERHADGELNWGDTVKVYQPGEPDMDTTAKVVSLHDNGRIELEVAWPRF